MEVLYWGGGGEWGIWGFDKFFFLCFGIFIFSFLASHRRMNFPSPISHFAF